MAECRGYFHQPDGLRLTLQFGQDGRDHGMAHRAIGMRGFSIDLQGNAGAVAEFSYKRIRFLQIARSEYLAEGDRNIRLSGTRGGRSDRRPGGRGKPAFR